MTFDIGQVPFSRFGSYLAISRVTPSSGESEGLYIRTITGDAGRRELLRMEWLDGTGATEDTGGTEPTVSATPAILTLGNEEVQLCFSSSQTLRIHGRRGIRLTATRRDLLDNAIELAPDRWLLNFWDAQFRLHLTVLSGSVKVDADWNRITSEGISLVAEPGDDKFFELALEGFREERTDAGLDGAFQTAAAETASQFEAFRSALPEVPAVYSAASELAAYVDWASVVEPWGQLARPAMLMSKNWMTNVWSWDHCFNALALATIDPDLAWDQLMIPFDHQHETGALPDSVNNAGERWNYCKPPIHGWAVKKLMKAGIVTDARLREIYEPLARWTMWWFRCRDDDRDGIPQYNHGNDSGWDNSTVFGVRPPIESPELSAFLVLQMETLSEIAILLGRDGHSRQWEARAAELVQRLLDHFLQGVSLPAVCSGSHTIVESRSLLTCLPIVLGQRLPNPLRTALVRELGPEGPFLTRHGLATEQPESPAYEPDGYWRGPIWAPSTLLVIDGLAACGEASLASDVARRFCDLCTVSGFAENFDALTGEGLRDRAYTWTSSIFLILASQYLQLDG